MNSFRCLACATVLLASLALRAAETPDAEFTRVAALIDASKTEEAVREIDALIRRYPDDGRLTRLRAKLAPAAAAAAQPAAPALATGTREKLQDLEQVAVAAAGATPGSESRQKLWREVLLKSAFVLGEFPDHARLWGLRATAALELNEPLTGFQAGQKLKALSGSTATDRVTLDTLAALEGKGWLDAAYGAALQEKSDRDLRMTAWAKHMERQIRKWSGNYAGDKAGPGGVLRYTVTLQPDGAVLYSVGQKDPTRPLNSGFDIGDDPWSVEFPDGCHYRVRHGDAITLFKDCKSCGAFPEPSGLTLLGAEYGMVDGTTLKLAKGEGLLPMLVRQK